MGSWLTAMCAAVFAASICGVQPAPQPSDPGGGDNLQAQTRSVSEDRSAEQRGTPNRPLAVQIVDSEESRRDKASAADHAKEKESIDWKLMAYTGGIFGATVVLAIATGFLAGYTRRLWDATLKLGQDSERSIAASEKTADIALKQIVLSQQQFIATHRPRFTVRLVELVVSDPGNPLTVKFTLFNSGLTGADIEETRADLVLAEMPPYPDDKAGQDVTGKLALEPSRPVIKCFTKQGLTRRT